MTLEAIFYERDKVSQEKGIEKGREEGRKEEREKAKAEQEHNILAALSYLTDEKISNVFKISLDELDEIREKYSK